MSGGGGERDVVDLALWYKMKMKAVATPALVGNRDRHSQVGRNREAQHATKEEGQGERNEAFPCRGKTHCAWNAMHRIH